MSVDVFTWTCSAVTVVASAVSLVMSYKARRSQRRADEILRRVR